MFVILDGMILCVVGEDYVMLIMSIIEMVCFIVKDLYYIFFGVEFLCIRGNYVLFVYFFCELGVKEGCDDVLKGFVVFCEMNEGMFVGIVIDDIVG